MQRVIIEDGAVYCLRDDGSWSKLAQLPMSTVLWSGGVKTVKNQNSNNLVDSVSVSIVVVGKISDSSEYNVNWQNRWGECSITMDSTNHFNCSSVLNNGAYQQKVSFYLSGRSLIHLRNQHDTELQKSFTLTSLNFPSQGNFTADCVDAFADAGSLTITNLDEMEHSQFLKLLNHVNDHRSDYSWLLAPNSNSVFTLDCKSRQLYAGTRKWFLNLQRPDSPILAVVANPYSAAVILNSHGNVLLRIGSRCTITPIYNRFVVCEFRNDTVQMRLFGLNESKTMCVKLDKSQCTQVKDCTNPRMFYLLEFNGIGMYRDNKPNLNIWTFENDEIHCSHEVHNNGQLGFALARSFLVLDYAKLNEVRKILRHHLIGDLLNLICEYLLLR